jgi:hypothetical protein
MDESFLKADDAFIRPKQNGRNRVEYGRHSPAAKNPPVQSPERNVDSDWCSRNPRGPGSSPARQRSRWRGGRDVEAQVRAPRRWPASPMEVNFLEHSG